MSAAAGAGALLPDDVSRCAGRIGGLGPDDPVCARRDRCMRYLAMLAQPMDEPYPPHTPVHTALCRDGGDYLLEASA